MPLSVEERQKFLAEPRIAALSVSAGPDRGPLTVPMWYQYTPGGEVWVLTSVASVKAELIRAAGRFTLMVDRVEPTIRYVAVEGPVTRRLASASCPRDSTGVRVPSLTCCFVTPTGTFARTSVRSGE
jgi:hypothetical protein